MSEVIAVDGSTAAHYDYAPFGAVTTSYGDSAATNPWRFSSEYAEDDLGLVYYNYRHYEPVAGRWLSRDSIEENGGIALYGFCKNNPTLFDVLGKKWKITRKGDIYADACATSKLDTFQDLADLLQLNGSEYHLWAHTDDMNVKRGKIYKIPNVMVAYTSKPVWFIDGIASIAYRLRKRVEHEANEYEQNKFHVIRYLLCDDENDFIDSWQTEGIYAIAFAGHGDRNGFGFIASPSSGWAVAPGDITVKYQLASIHAYSCFSADYITDSKTNKGKLTDLLADFGSWAGYHGSATHFSSLEVDDNSIDD